MEHSVELTKEMQKEITSFSKKMSIVAIVIGLVFSAILAIIIYIVKIDSFYFNMSLYISLTLFGLGIIMLITIFISIKRVEKDRIIAEYEFFENYLKVSTNKNGDLINIAKIYYKEIKRVKETVNYFLMFLKRGGALLLDKNELKDWELLAIKTWINEAK